MKRSQILVLVLIALTIGFIVSAIGDSSTYANAQEALSNPGEEYHVVGTLNKDVPVVYNPSEDASATYFTLLDNQGVEMPVVLHKAKPQDFERSESVVLIGEANEEGTFHATDVLMKCPSKYNDQGQVIQE